MSYPQSNPESNPIYTVSNYILDRLFQLGIRQFFALPGDYAAFFLDALEQNPNLQHASTTDFDQGYASRACHKGQVPDKLQLGADSRVNGKFPLVNFFAADSGAVGPGKHEAMVLIAPGFSVKERQRRGSQGILLHLKTGNRVADQQVLEHAAVAAVVIRDADTAPQLIDYALTAMMTHRRPVSIEVLQDVEVDKCDRPHGQLQVLPCLGESKSLAAMLDAVWACILQARLPVIWVGSEIARHGLQELLQQIIDISGLYFATQEAGQTGLNEASLQFIGVYNEVDSGTDSDPSTRVIMHASDCVLALGALMSDDYLHRMAQSYEQTIEVNDAQARIAWSKYPDVYLQVFLQGLLQRFQSAHYVAKSYTRPHHVPEIACHAGMVN